MLVSVFVLCLDWCHVYWCVVDDAVDTRSAYYCYWDHLSNSCHLQCN